MKNLDKANEWLQRAKSNMARAKAGRVSPEILYEDLCYDAQQAVEKETLVNMMPRALYQKKRQKISFKQFESLGSR